MKIYFIPLITLLLFIAGCNSKSNIPRKPVTNIQITPANNTVTMGNEFTITIESKITKPNVVDLEVYLNNRLIKKTSEINFQIPVDSDTLKTGKYSIKTIAKNSDGKIGINFSSISVLSDIQPINQSYQIIEILAHNTNNFTQGLEFYKGKLYEGTGNYADSYIYVYNPSTEKVYKSLKLDNQYFGEGITILNDKLYQLTYKSKKGFVYNATTLEKLNEFSFSSDEGWGLTNNGKYLIMSNGTSTITYINPFTFEIEKTIEVCTPTDFITNLNELEFVDGNIYSNIWTSQTIVKFEAETGKVLALINMDGLMSTFSNSRIDVLNGIAYEKNENLFYITGKWWPNLYKVKFQ